MTFNRNLLDASAFHLGGDGAEVAYTDGTFAVPSNCKGVFLASTGDVVCTPLHADEAVTLTGWPAGAQIPYHLASITESGTTATLITVLD